MASREEHGEEQGRHGIEEQAGQNIIEILDS
jgi:hypothetical protein